MKIRSKIVSIVLVLAMLFFVAYQGLLSIDSDSLHADAIQKKGQDVWEDGKQTETLEEEFEQAIKDITSLSSDEKETLYFWYTDEALTDYLNSCAYAFMENHEGVRIVPTLVSPVEYIENIHSASVREEIYPDLFLVTNDCLEKAYLSGLATKIEDAQKVVNTNVYPETAVSAVTYKDKIVAYPMYFETSLFLYNKSYLESMAQAKAQALADEEAGEKAQAEADALAESGQTDSLPKGELEAESENAKDENSVSVDGQSSEVNADNDASDNAEENFDEQMYEEEEIPENSEVISESLIPQTFNEILTLADEYDAPQDVEAILRWDVSDVFYNYFFAGNFMNLGGKNGDDETQIDINNDLAVESLNVYQSLNQFFSIDAKETDYDKVLKAFIEGKTIFTVATSDAIEIIERAKLDGSFAWDYGIAPIPNVTKELASKGLSVTNVVCVNGYTKDSKVANEFARFITSQADGDLYARTGKPAAYKYTNNENEKLEAVLKAYEQSTSLPKLMRASNFWVQLEAAYTDIWNGKDTKQVLDALQEQMLKQLQ